LNYYHASDIKNELKQQYAKDFSMRKLILPGFLILSLFGYSIAVTSVKEIRKNIIKTQPLLYLPPKEALSLLTFEFKTLFSKILTFRANIYFGETTSDEIKPDYYWFYKMYEAAIELDPYNIDSYYVAQAVLPWDGHLVRETNKLLEIGMKSRTWDWYLPFFIAFNNFYFLKDDKKAAEYFSKASQIDARIATIAGKYFQKAGETSAGLAFLKIMYDKTSDEGIRNNISKRINSLEQIAYLENAIVVFRIKTGIFPSLPEQLISAGVIDKLPVDPFGKVYFIREDGKIELKNIKNKK
jgi:hypothetical protein